MSKHSTANGKPELDEELAALLRLMAEGKEAALERFYDLTSRRVYALALRVVRNSQTAEEVTEDVFFQVWREAGRYDLSRGAPMAWLFTICRSRALDALRRVDDAELYSDPMELEARIGSDDNDPSGLLETMERAGAVHTALSRLSPQARQLVSLAFFRGLSHSEIAANCDMPLGTVKTTINRACDKMRSYLVAEAGAAS